MDPIHALWMLSRQSHGRDSEKSTHIWEGEEFRNTDVS